MEAIIKLLKNAKSALILPHISADGDAIGSCQAMKCVLRGLGIRAEIYAEEIIDEYLGFIADGILLYEGSACEYDTCIVLDCGSVDRLGTRAELLDKAVSVVNIDHHKTNTLFGDANLVEPDSSATGEVLYGVFKAMEAEITRDIAGYLYAAICSDTGGFAYSNVSADTFRIAAELVERDIRHADISRLLFDCVDMQSELLKAELTKNINTYCDGRVRTVVISKEFASQFDLDPNQVDGLVELPRRIRGTQIALAIKELDDKIRVSIRSTGKADVSKIAMKFDGGGHEKAAGCSIFATDIKEAEKMLVEACENELQTI